MPRRMLPGAFLLLLIAAPAAAQPAAPIAHVQGRAGMPLNGAWRTIVDPFEAGYYTYHQELAPYGYYNDARPADKSDRVEYSFDEAPLLEVPGDWNTQQPELFFYEGTVWYRRQFDYALPPGRRLFIHFGGANYEARAWLNRQPLGMHEGGFTPFAFEITDHVRAEGNSLVVKVDNRRRAEAVPPLQTDWWNYGGLTRDVRLVEVPETFVADYLVQLDPQAPDQIAGWVRLDGPDAAGQPVTIRLPELGAEVTATTDADGQAPFRLPADVERWAPGHPRRYAVHIEAGADAIAEPIGFRTVAVEGTEILLNGEPLFLRGISIHEEAPMRGGRAYAREDAEVLLGWVQELGGNFARLAHYPHNEHMPRVADSLGILLWEEIPVYWAIDWENAATLDAARQQLTELITRDRNRAAVILWSIANETPVTEARYRFLSDLAETARRLDPSRLVTAALERRYTDPRTQLIDDPIGAVLDVVGVNEYVGWYDGLPAKADSLRWEATYAKPIIVSEFGAGARSE
ncbi:MAG: glycoside hydrolase family 2 TIM barrel-domain containing protein, partial [Rhodothermales bacterium]|nr:glycoside hydrolase family 2 TIM barrel-domain containing protein [Rhodothermales bacterium]